ncbi:MAG: hypothetical protein Q27BPR15_08560 [Rhodobacter sp. CACIA14H1]|nr:MAG: hypothetical protein Q27BPR15_08560 [Rhodobacter sp. CACIA14H1]
MTGRAAIPILAKALLEGRVARDRVLRSSYPKALVSDIERLLDHPIYFALLELEVNGCTSFRGSVALLTQSLAHYDEVSISLPEASELTVPFLDLTNFGRKVLVHEVEETVGERTLTYFRKELGQFLYVDDGYGFVATAARIREAASQLDYDFLLRLAHPTSGEFVVRPILDQSEHLLATVGRDARWRIYDATNVLSEASL